MAVGWAGAAASSSRPLIRRLPRLAVDGGRGNDDCDRDDDSDRDGDRDDEDDEEEEGAGEIADESAGNGG